MAAREKPEVRLPDSAADQPRLGRLGLVAAGCFAVGALWPGLAGIDLAPRPPGVAEPPGEEPPAEPAPQPEPPPPDDVPSVSKRAPRLTRDEVVQVERFVVTSCGDGKHWQESDCDRPEVDGVVEEAIERLAQCESAAGTTGVLSLGVELDFQRGHVTHLRSGRSTSLSGDRAAALLACADSVVIGTPLPKVHPRHQHYWAYYLARFVPPGSPIGPDEQSAGEPLVPTSGQATVGWKTAIVRSEPSEEADIRARLLYGTRVDVSARSGDWYRVQLPDDETGWVHAHALGL